jgi:hypothetical protein
VLLRKALPPPLQNIPVGDVLRLRSWLWEGKSMSHSTLQGLHLVVIVVIALLVVVIRLSRR